MKVDYLGDWVAHRIEFAVVPQPEELQVLAWIIGVVEQPVPQTSLSSANGIVLPLHFPSKQQTLLVLKIASEPRHQRQHHVHPKFLILFDSLHYPQVNSVGDFILDSVGVCSRRDEELVLYVDVALGLRDELKIGDVYAELSVALMAADGPVAHGSHDLALITALFQTSTVVVALVDL